MSASNAAARAAIDGAHPARLVTVNKDGSPAGFVLRITPARVSGVGPW